MDDARFEQVWERHASAVLRYCTYSLGSSQEGEDVAAETFAQFLVRGDRVPVDRAEAWLIRVARNLCASHHRAASRQRRLQDRLVHQVPVPEDTDGWSRPECWDHLRALKETERLVVYLRAAEERPFAEIARLIGKSEAATKMTFYRATDRLRAAMRSDRPANLPDLQGGTENV